jgi:hypothetical protein
MKGKEDKMARKEQLSDKDFLGAQLRTIAESGDCDGISLGIRLGALDRLAAVLGVYRVASKVAGGSHVVGS